MSFDHISKVFQKWPRKVGRYKILGHLHVCTISSDESVNETQKSFVLEQGFRTFEKQRYDSMKRHQYMFVFVVTLKNLKILEAFGANQWYRMTPKSHQNSSVTGYRLFLPYTVHYYFQWSIRVGIRNIDECFGWRYDNASTHWLWLIELMKSQFRYQFPGPQSKCLFIILRSNHPGHLRQRISLPRFCRLI